MRFIPEPPGQDSLIIVGHPAGFSSFFDSFFLTQNKEGGDTSLIGPPVFNQGPINLKKGDHWALMANFWEKKASKCAKSQTMYDNLILKKSWQFNFSPVYSRHSSDFVTLGLIFSPYPFTCLIFDNNTLNFLKRRDVRKNIFLCLDTIRGWGPATKKPKAIVDFYLILRGDVTQLHS